MLKHVFGNNVKNNIIKTKMKNLSKKSPTAVVWNLCNPFKNAPKITLIKLIGIKTRKTGVNVLKDSPKYCDKKFENINNNIDINILITKTSTKTI